MNKTRKKSDEKSTFSVPKHKIASSKDNVRCNSGPSYSFPELFLPLGPAALAWDAQN